MVEIEGRNLGAGDTIRIDLGTGESYRPDRSIEIESIGIGKEVIEVHAFDPKDGEHFMLLKPINWKVGRVSSIDPATGEVKY